SVRFRSPIPRRVHDEYGLRRGRRLHAGVLHRGWAHGVPLAARARHGRLVDRRRDLRGRPGRRQLRRSLGAAASLPARRPSANQRVQVVYPARLVPLRGTVEDAAGRAQPSIQVAAVDANASDANVISTTALSDGSLNPGTFWIVVPGDATQVYLLLRPTDTNP